MDELKKSWVPTLFLVLGIAICAVSIVWIWPERHYYFLSAAQRALHPHHDFLRSSGKGGLCFGAAGTLLILVNLTYLIRRNLIRLAWLGSLRSWMSFHVFTGLVAGAMVILHSAFLLKSALGIMAFSSMAIVVVTGLIGRYIYAHTPRSLKGQELELDDIRHRLSGYQERLQTLGLPHEFFTVVQAPVIHGSDRSLFASIMALAAGDRELRAEQLSLRQMVMSQPRLSPLMRDILPLADQYCRERQWAARYSELRGLMGSWRFLHRWFAILLVSAVLFHVWIAFMMGDLWLTDVFLKFYATHHF